MPELGGSRRRTIGQHVLQPQSLMLGYGYDPHLSEGALKCPLFQTASFVFRSAEEGKAFFELAYGLRDRAPAEEPGLIYSRLNNPNLQILEERLALWDGAETALAFASGMAAISTTLLASLRPGDTLLWSDPVYGGTEYLIEHVLPQFGISVRPFSSSGEHGALSSDLAVPPGGRVGAILIETPAGPTNRLVDIGRCARLAASLAEGTGHRPLVIVDNTLLGPLGQRPLDHGADIVVYSLSKGIGGHDDLVAGAAAGADSHLHAVRTLRTVLGSVCSPHSAWLVLRSLETLAIRTAAVVQHARQVAEFLRGHEKVSAVHHLDLLDPDDWRRDLVQRQCLTAGSAFAFEVRGGEQAAFSVMNRLQLIKLGVSLGGSVSQIQHPATMTHADLPEERHAQLGITPGLLRLTVGLEDPADLIADLEAALAAA